MRHRGSHETGRRWGLAPELGLEYYRPVSRALPPTLTDTNVGGKAKVSNHLSKRPADLTNARGLRLGLLFVLVIDFARFDPLTAHCVGMNVDAP